MQSPWGYTPLQSPLGDYPPVVPPARHPLQTPLGLQPPVVPRLGKSFFFFDFFGLHGGGCRGAAGGCSPGGLHGGVVPHGGDCMGGVVPPKKKSEKKP